MTELRITADVEVVDTETLRALAEPGNDHLKTLALALVIECSLRGNAIRLAGEAASVDLAERFLAEAAQIIRGGGPLARRRARAGHRAAVRPGARAPRKGAARGLR
jgi:phosphate starvation-inducible protein PhoH and related proteins